LSIRFALKTTTSTARAHGREAVRHGPLLRRRVVTIATNVARELISDTRQRERAWRSRQPNGHHIRRRIHKAEVRTERRLLATMERELKARHGEKHWRQRSILRLAANTGGSRQERA
jgi:hypothetical protein